MENKESSDSWEYLLGVPEETEADIIIGLLEGEAGIPVRKIRPGIGQFMYVAAGLANWIELWVPQSRLEEAKSILEIHPAAEDDDADQAESDQANSDQDHSE